MAIHAKQDACRINVGLTFGALVTCSRPSEFEKSFGLHFPKHARHDIIVGELLRRRAWPQRRPRTLRVGRPALFVEGETSAQNLLPDVLCWPTYSSVQPGQGSTIPSETPRIVYYTYFYYITY